MGYLGNLKTTKSYKTRILSVRYRLNVVGRLNVCFSIFRVK